jgi:dethiobiotin synthetase
VIIIITGTDTGVGKTIVSAAYAARETGSVVVVKPVQTGIAGDQLGDAGTVHRLTGRTCQEFTTLADPLAPDTAARYRGVAIPLITEYVDRIRVLETMHDLVIVEGAGGVLVRLDTAGGTILDLADALDAELHVVTRAGLGTLNHTSLTVAALRSRNCEPQGLIIGSWPADPDLAATTNRSELPALTGVPLIGVVPQGAGELSREEFLTRAPTWFSGSGEFVR